jgi:hypothetical protein
MAVKVTRAGVDEPLIPDIAGMTSKVCSTLDKSPKKALLDLVKSHLAADGVGNPTVESFLSHIRALRQVVGVDSVRGMNANDLDQLDVEICTQIATLANQELPNKSTAFHKLAVWIGATQRTYPVEIFTTNYDLLVEQALEGNRVPYFDGFVGTYKTFFDLQAMEGDPLPARWARLWKIHGSLNWFLNKAGSIHRGEVDGGGGERRVIYPSHLKYDESRRMPYLAMIDRLRAFLKQPASAVLVVGYSFNDEHLNDVIVQGLQGNPTAICFGLLFNGLKNYPVATNLATTRSNLSLFASDEAVIGTRRCPWTMGRDAGSVPHDSLAVEWVNDPSKPGTKRAVFKLGDFSNLGSFLEELIGEKERKVVV